MERIPSGGYDDLRKGLGTAGDVSTMEDAIHGASKGIGEPPDWRIVKKKRIINVASGVNTDGLELSHDSENSLQRNESMIAGETEEER